ncbi:MULTISPECIES: alkene reductase [Micromonospora]|uniref:N-ethylmaleimide reductase n=1 Tax=Micromonospora yangpuensis TaxID=683228 RepID=A0A1C6UJY2_9ACTN|nr:alkene reductase [Micromonospora yangpuensis]GGM30918.1 alkene reductase [Micromonospora yangpuensis]SCL54248.1 N-ethylmaleimide reductase [Micromonospora yangpuensis]
MTSLFDNVSLGGLRLPNRVVMAPMSRVRSDREGLATASMATYYAQRATAGLIITEGTYPNPVGQSNPLTPGLYTPAQTDSWRQVTSAVHTNGGRVFAQLMHGGRISHPDTTGHQPVAPSAVAPREVYVFTPTGPQLAPTPRALSTAEVEGEVESFAAAARRAIVAGFDGVELHGANGYLMNQFLSGNTNLRTDRYGGSVSGHIRFAVEAVAATIDAVGADRVGLRLSPGAGVGDTVDTDIPAVYGALLAELVPLGPAYVHLAGTDDEILLGLRRAWPGTLIVNPSIPGTPVPSNRADAERWLAQGADLVAFGRAYLANPDLVERFRADLPLAVADLDTYYTGGDDGYLTYPAYAHPPLTATASV